VNEVLPGGWLEFLGRVELSADAFDDAAERGKRAKTAADDIVGAVVHDDAIDVSGLPDDSVEIIDTPARASDAVNAPAAENKGVTDAIDADAATAPSAAEPMIMQSIWDASAVLTASREDLRFMPFFELNPSKLSELRTLQGHSETVRRAASALYTAFVIWVFVVGHWRCRVPRRAARRVWVVGQHAQVLGGILNSCHADMPWSARRGGKVGIKPS
jgi:hypothetical protein